MEFVWFIIGLTVGILLGGACRESYLRSRYWMARPGELMGKLEDDESIHVMMWKETEWVKQKDERQPEPWEMN